MAKKVGRRAQLSGDFELPVPPINVTLTDVGTNRPFNNAAAVVSFDYPPNQLPIISYTVIVNCGAQGSFSEIGTSSPITVIGIPQGAVGTATVKATNANGQSEASAASSSVTFTTVPAAPATVTSTSNTTGPGHSTTDLNGLDTVSWSASTSG